MTKEWFPFGHTLKREQERDCELDALLARETADAKRRSGFALTNEEFRSLALPRPPDWAAFWDAYQTSGVQGTGRDKKFDGFSRFQAVTQLLLIALLYSDVPLSSPMRSFIARQLRDDWFPSSPVQKRHQHGQALAQLIEDEKRELQKEHPSWSKAKVERVVAEDHRMTVVAMRKRLQRANRTKK